MDLVDRKLLNIIQSGFLLVDEPYKDIGYQLDMNDGELSQRLAVLRKNNVVRQIRAIFDTRRLGYTTISVAMVYLPTKLHEASLEINDHSGVRLNCARESYEEAVAEISKATYLDIYLILYNSPEYKKTRVPYSV